MRLYYSPGACSLASHIVLRETQSRFSLVRVQLAGHRLEDGSDFHAINARAQVPVLELDDGTRVCEGPVVMQFIADQAGTQSLLPPHGSLARVRVLEWCNHLTSEIHKSFTPLFHAPLDDASLDTLRQILKKKLAYLDAHLRDQDHLTGPTFTIADAYLFVLLGWAPHVKLDLSDLVHLADFRARVGTRPAVREALRAEGLTA